MILSDLAIRRPVVASVGAALLTIAGLVGFGQLSVREYPETDPPVISVQTLYTGAAANVIENRITQPLEQRLAGVEGIETIISRSSDGRSDISVEFRAGRDVDSAANDVRDRVSSALSTLPEDVLAPEIRKVDADASPVLFLNVRNPGWSKLKLTDYINRVLADRFSTIDGVAQIQLVGAAQPSMRVWLNVAKLAAFRLTPHDVEAALASQNVELPAGRVETRNQNVTLRVTRGFTTPEQFASLVIGRGSDGYLVRLGDVARIEPGPENPYTTYHFNGQTGIGMGIIRQSGANTLAVVNAAKQLAADLAPTLPAGMTLTVGSDTSLFIDRAIAGVWGTLAEAAVLVVLVIFLFLGSWRATLIPAVTVPICLLGSFAVLWACGYSINLLTLLALVLAIGLVVDDAIVVLENVHHRIEGGEEPLVAAFHGSRQVGFAVMSTTLVVCAVFVPVMFIAGQTGLFFRELAVTMIGALAFSGLIALSLAPMLCSKLLRPGSKGWLSRTVNAGLTRLENAYRRALEIELRRPLLVIIPVLAFLIGSALLFTTLDSELAPPEDTGQMQIRLNAPEGTGFDALSRYTEQAEQMLLPMVKPGLLRGVIMRVPGSLGNSDDFNNSAFTVYLVDWEQRHVTTAMVVRDINKKLGTLVALRGNASAPSSLGRGRGQPINFVIAGTDYAGLARARDRILAAAKGNPGLINLDADYVELKPQLLVDIDRERAGDLGISVDEISQALQTLMGSRRVSTYVDEGEEYRVIVQADSVDRNSPASLDSVYVRARSGDLVPLSSVVRTRDSASARELGRYNKMRAITLQGGLAPDYPLGRALAFLEDQARQSPEVAAVGYRGESQAFKQTGSSIWAAFGLTIVVVYLLLAAQFESFIHPAVIITTVPLAVGGGVIGLALTGGTLNLFSQIGIVMLVGLAAKNGILIVEFANQLRDTGVGLHEAIVQASTRRLRPILMTSIATVMGAIPLALSHGAGAGARSAIGVVVVFGVSTATALTLFLVPFLYAVMAARTRSPKHVALALERALARRAEAAPLPAE